MRHRRETGFSLIEAIASVFLIAIGVVVLLEGLTAFGRSQARALEAEKMQLLAMRKFDEIAATGALPTGQASGDFTDAGEPDFKWTAERDTHGTDNLDSVRIDVERKTNTVSQPYELQALICRPVPPKDTTQ